MLSFEVPKEKVKEIILHFSKYYDIEENQIDEIIKNLEEYSNINQKLKDNDSSGFAITNSNSNPVRPDTELSEDQVDINLTERNTSNTSSRTEIEK
jgi:hypothetical protein